MRPAEMMLRCFLYFMSDNFFTVQCCCSFFFSLDSSFEVLNAFLCALNLPRDATKFHNSAGLAAVAVMFYACAGICDRRKISSTNTRILMYAPKCVSHTHTLSVYRYDVVSHSFASRKRNHNQTHSLLAPIETTHTHFTHLHTLGFFKVQCKWFN